MNLANLRIDVGLNDSGINKTLARNISGNGSKANVEDLASGGAQLAFCQSDVMSYAYSGTNLFADSGAVKDFSVVAALYMEQVQIVTMNPDIKTVSDLKGKKVSIGASGSGVYFNAMDVLKAYDMSVDDIDPQYLDFGDSAEGLKDGKIDAALSHQRTPPPHSGHRQRRRLPQFRPFAGDARGDVSRSRGVRYARCAAA